MTGGHHKRRDVHHTGDEPLIVNLTDEGAVASADVGVAAEAGGVADESEQVGNLADVKAVARSGTPAPGGADSQMDKASPRLLVCWSSDEAYASAKALGLEDEDEALRHEEKSDVRRALCRRGDAGGLDLALAETLDDEEAAYDEAHKVRKAVGSDDKAIARAPQCENQNCCESGECTPEITYVQTALKVPTRVPTVPVSRVLFARVNPRTGVATWASPRKLSKPKKAKKEKNPSKKREAAGPPSLKALALAAFLPYVPTWPTRDGT